MGASTDPWRIRAHLFPLPRCRVCGRAATHELRNGVNAGQGLYCPGCGRAALKDFKEGKS